MIRSYLSAVRAVLAENNIRINENLFLINSLTHACKLKNDQVITRLPIDKGLLNLLIKETDRYFAVVKNQPYLCCLYKALLASGYYGLLRISELTKSEHTILARNMHIGENKNKILFILETSKMHTQGDKPQLVKISQKPIKSSAKRIQRHQHSKYLNNSNPFYILQQFLAIRPPSQNESEQFCVFTDNSPVSPDNLRSTLKLMLTRVGLDSSLYNIHSLRIGRTGNLMDLGLSVKTIKKLGRWKSNAVFAYLRN